MEKLVNASKISLDGLNFLNNISFEVQVFIAIGLIFALLLACFVILIILSAKYRNLKKTIATGINYDTDIEEIESGEFFSNESDHVETEISSENCQQIINKIDEVAQKQQKYFDKIKVVRYNSTLADESVATCFSMAITNADADGVVISGTEKPDGSTKLVVKSIKNGKSNVDLTEAEKVAVLRKGEKKC